MKVLVPLRTGTGQNDREHHHARARRVKAERHAVAWLLALHKPPAGPVIVTMCRISPGPGLDAHDNLRASLKAPVDQVAAWLGRDDRDPSITWAYEQRRSKPGEWMVAIEVLSHREQDVGETCRLNSRCVTGVKFGHIEARSGVLGADAAISDDMNGCAPSLRDTSRSREKGVSAHMSEGQHLESISCDALYTKARAHFTSCSDLTGWREEKLCCLAGFPQVGCQVQGLSTSVHQGGEFRGASTQTDMQQEGFAPLSNVQNALPAPFDFPRSWEKRVAVSVDGAVHSPMVMVDRRERKEVNHG
ncbi:hypothetical protein GT347_20200 [Xylophilus rhododendri]|uniref:Uncharacterized protein n=1 Tax=Xylophilus rhododendri TaxID=2697032 RepID=A0A857J8A4_9BURK|nr:hypothetical protein [Xylophilus rhododendri]QHJ00097.1 hypothetical protein GT347_20200 [Xylophilus rhododendri]